MIDEIKSAENHIELGEIIDELLNNENIQDHQEETYSETATRIESEQPEIAALVILAESKWFELSN